MIWCRRMKRSGLCCCCLTFVCLRKESPRDLLCVYDACVVGGFECARSCLYACALTGAAIEREHPEVEFSFRYVPEVSSAIWTRGGCCTF